jgi:hypothetical protein
MKQLLAIVILISSTTTLAGTKSFQWGKSVIEVPTDWNTKQTPMPSLKGYFLRAQIGSDDVHFFVHEHKPKNMATASGSERYWKEFNLDISLNKKQKKCEVIGKYKGYRCQVYYQTKDKNWTYRAVHWFSNRRRVIIRAEGLKTKEVAKTLAQNIGVSVK